MVCHRTAPGRQGGRALRLVASLLCLFARLRTAPCFPVFFSTNGSALITSALGGDVVLQPTGGAKTSPRVPPRQSLVASTVAHACACFSLTPGASLSLTTGAVVSRALLQAEAGVLLNNTLVNEPLISSFTAASAPCGQNDDPVQCAAMIALVLSTTWKASTFPTGQFQTYCKWSGVTCAGYNGSDVAAINLAGRGFYGHLPEVFGAFTALKSLDLSGNNLAGTFPSTLGFASGLTYLSLAGNAFIGTLPASLALLSSLTTLQMAFNSFTSPLPLGFANMTALRNADLSYNMLDDTANMAAVLQTTNGVSSLCGNPFTNPVPTVVQSFLSRCVLQINSTSLSSPQRIIMDQSNTIFVADTGHHQIVRIFANGSSGVWAGSGLAGRADGVGTAALFNSPKGISLDANGTAYVADTGNNAVRKIFSNGTVVTLAGGLQVSAGFADGLCSGAQSLFSGPTGIAVDSLGNIYVADGTNRIRSISSTGQTGTVAGTGFAGLNDGFGGQSIASFNDPRGITAGSDGTLYVMDFASQTIRKVFQNGSVVTFAGSGAPGYADGVGTAASFNAAQRLSIDGSGNIFVADAGNNRIRKVFPNATVVTYAGSGFASYIDGQSISAGFNSPQGIAVGASGMLYVADSISHVIRKINASGYVSTLAGSRIEGYVDSSGIAAYFNTPVAVAVTPSGSVLVNDLGNAKIRQISAAGVVTTVTTTSLGARDVFSDTYGSILVVDTVANRLWNVSSNAIVAIGAAFAGAVIAPSGSVFATVSNTVVRANADSSYQQISGTGNPGASDGGPAALVNNARGVAVDSKNNVYFTTGGNLPSLRVLNVTTGSITTVFSSASNFGPYGGFVSGAGVFVADATTSQIKLVNLTSGIVSVLSGSGVAGFEDGAAVLPPAEFNSPCGISFDPSGNVFVADQYNHRIVAVSQTGASRTVSGMVGFAASNDGGPAPYPLPMDVIGNFRIPSFSGLSGVAAGLGGTVYFADTLNCCIRVLLPNSSVYSLSGNCGVCDLANGAGRDSRFFYPEGMVISNDKSTLYVADYINRVIRAVNASTGVTSTYTSLQFYPMSLAWTSTGDMYVTGNNAVYILSSSTPLITGFSFSDDPIPGRDWTAFSGVVSANDVIYVSDTNTHTIWSYSNGARTLLAGGGVSCPGSSSTATCGLAGYVDGNGAGALFSNPLGIIMASDNSTLFVADNGNNFIRTINVATGAVSTLQGITSPRGLAYDASGLLLVTTTYELVRLNASSSWQKEGLAGAKYSGGTVPSGPSSGSADAAYSYAQYNNPTGTAVDGDGNVFVADTNNNVIRVILNSSGYSYTLTRGVGFADGPCESALFDRPMGLAFGPNYNNLFVADYNNNRIRVISFYPTCIVSTLAGFGYGGYGCAADGVATNQACIANPSDVAVDSSANVYTITDGGARIRMISNGMVTTLAASTCFGGLADEPGVGISTATPCFDNAQSVIVVDPVTGILYFTDNYRVRKMNPQTGLFTTVAGLRNAAGYVDGAAASARFNVIQSIRLDPSRSFLLVSERNNNRIRKISLVTGSVSTLAGDGNAGFLSGPGVDFNSPMGVVQDKQGNTFVADTYNHRVRIIYPNGSVSVFAGIGVPGYKDGLGNAAQFNTPQALCIDNANVLYVADTGNSNIRKISPNGTVTTMAGSTVPAAGFLDGIGTAALFRSPAGITVDASGTVYVSDTGNNRVRKVTPGGVVTTIGGIATAGFAEGNMLAAFSSPTDTAVDAAGNVYVADSGNHRIRKVSTTGFVTTVAGSGLAALIDANNSNLMALNTPTGLALNASALFIADTNNRQVRKLDVGTGFLTSLAQSGSLSAPVDVAFDAAGNVFVADAGLNTVCRFNLSTGVCSSIFSGAGSALGAVSGVASDTLGNLAIADPTFGSLRNASFVGRSSVVPGGATSSNSSTLSITLSPLCSPIDDPVQCSALVAFAKATSYRAQSKINPPNLGSTFCSWPGVTCGGPSGSDVVSFAVNGYGLYGHIPPELSLLKSLTYLDLSSNTLTGTIPASLGSFQANFSVFSHTCDSRPHCIATRLAQLVVSNLSRCVCPRVERALRGLARLREAL